LDIPSSLVVVGTNVSSPALAELTHAVSSLGPIVNSLEKFFLALMILSLLNSGLAIILSFLGIFLPQNRFILYGNVSLISIGMITRTIDAILATAIAVLLSYITNKFGSTLGVSAQAGGIFIALIWVGFVCQLVAGLYWLGVWFVEFRQISFRARTRDEGDVEDYRGILKEIKSDVLRPSTGPKEQEKEGVVV
jgi:hypothetical protein